MSRRAAAAVALGVGFSGWNMDGWLFSGGKKRAKNYGAIDMLAAPLPIPIVAGEKFGTNPLDGQKDMIHGLKFEIA